MYTCIIINVYLHIVFYSQKSRQPSPSASQTPPQRDPHSRPSQSRSYNIRFVRHYMQTYKIIITVLNSLYIIHTALYQTRFEHFEKREIY